MRFRDREAKALSRATANLSLKVLRVCFGEAVRQGLLALRIKDCSHGSVARARRNNSMQNCAVNSLACRMQRKSRITSLDQCCTTRYAQQVKYSLAAAIAVALAGCAQPDYSRMSKAQLHAMYNAGMAEEARLRAANAESNANFARQQAQENADWDRMELQNCVDEAKAEAEEAREAAERVEQRQINSDWGLLRQ